MRYGCFFFLCHPTLFIAGFEQVQPVKEFDYADFFMLCEFLKLANGIVEAASVDRLRHGIPHGGAEGTDERVLRARVEAREWDWRVGAKGTEECVLTIRICFFEEVHEAERVSVRRDQSTGLRTGGMRECRDHLTLASLH